MPSCTLKRSSWIELALVLTSGFTVLGWVGSRIYQEMPPSPERIVTGNGQAVALESRLASGTWWRPDSSASWSSSSAWALDTPSRTKGGLRTGPRTGRSESNRINWPLTSNVQPLYIADIQHYVDTIDYTLLLSLVARRISDRRALKRIQQ
jgi:hypothetical protein